MNIFSLCSAIDELSSTHGQPGCAARSSCREVDRDVVDPVPIGPLQAHAAAAGRPLPMPECRCGKIAGLAAILVGSPPIRRMDVLHDAVELEAPYAVVLDQVARSRAICLRGSMEAKGMTMSAFWAA
jgi:hypothetical protein